MTVICTLAGFAGGALVMFCIMKAKECRWASSCSPEIQVAHWRALEAASYAAGRQSALCKTRVDGIIRRAMEGVNK